MIEQIFTVDVFVRDKEEAVRFYVEKLGFDVMVDDTVAAGSGICLDDVAARWIAMVPRGGQLAIVPCTEEFHVFKAHRVGTPVEFQLHTDDLAATYADLCRRGVTFSEPPKHTERGMTASFLDPWGNRLSLVQPTS